MYPQPGREHYGVFVHEEALALAARGHEVQVIAGIPRTPPLLGRLRPAWRRLAALPAQRTLDGLPLRHPRYLLLPRRLAFAGPAGGSLPPSTPRPCALRFDPSTPTPACPTAPPPAGRRGACAALPITSHGSTYCGRHLVARRMPSSRPLAGAALIFPSRAWSSARRRPARARHVLGGYRRELPRAAAARPASGPCVSVWRTSSSKARRPPLSGGRPPRPVRRPP
jgi:hypothetical protein